MATRLASTSRKTSAPRARNSAAAGMTEESPRPRRGRPPKTQPSDVRAAVAASTGRGAKAVKASATSPAMKSTKNLTVKGTKKTVAEAGKNPKLTARPNPAARPARGRKGAAPNDEWWRGGVIYQIYPRSYQDSNGDGTGDLKGITQRLDHVASLGVDGIWLSPFFKSPMKDFGYDVSDYRDVDPSFGTLADFKALVKRAHELGLKVMIDQVLSHSSDQHPWFVESRQSRTNRKADWYVWADAKKDGTPPNNWLSIFGGSAWQWDTGRQQYYLHNFLTSQPDLNLHNRKVQDALLADVKFWLDLGVDGFRLDVVNFYFHSRSLKDNPARSRLTDVSGVTPVNPYSYQQHQYDKTQPENLAFLKRLRSLLDQYPNTAMVGEVGDDHALKVMADYTAGGDKLHMAYSFDLLEEHHSAPYLHKVFAQFGKIVGDGWPAWSLSNHDVVRVISRWGGQKGGEALARLAAAMLFTLRGTPYVYQGDELGLPEADIAFEDLQDPYGITMWPKFKGRDGCRTPMPWTKSDAMAGFTKADRAWLPVPAEHRALAVDQQDGKPGSMLSYYRQLLHWRKAQPALIKGEMTLQPANEQVLAYQRKHEDQTLLCVFNFSHKKASFELPARWKKDAAILTDSGITGAEIRRGKVMLEPYGGAVIGRASNPIPSRIKP